MLMSSKNLLTEEDLIFGVNLPTLLECINIFGSTSSGPVSLQISYMGKGYPLVLVLEENKMVTKCKINTMTPQIIHDLDFKGSSLAHKIIMQSEWLKEAFEDLDPSMEVVSILVSPVAPYLRLSTNSVESSVDMEYPKNTDVIEIFQCEQTQLNAYRLKNLLHMLKALSLSKKTSLRTNERGMLSVQFLIHISDEKRVFVEFFCLPLELTDDVKIEES